MKVLMLNGSPHDSGTTMMALKEMQTVFNEQGIETEIIAASIRTKEHILQCILAGVDIATIPYAQIEDMAKHPLTTAGIERFISDYSKVQK